MRLLERLEGIPDSSWERNTAEEFLNWALIQQGDLARTRARLIPGIQRAQDCGDLQLFIDLSAMLAAVEVFVGDLDRAQEVLDRATAGWSPDRTLFSHLWLFYARAPLALARGEVAAALTLCRETVTAMKPASLDQLPFIRDNVKEIQGRACVIAALSGDHAHLALARKRARELRKANNPVLGALADVIEAGLAIVAGDTEAAIEGWRRADAVFQMHNMLAHSAAIEFQLARLSTGDATGDLPNFFEREKITEPHRLANLLVPAFAP